MIRYGAAVLDFTSRNAYGYLSFAMISNKNNGTAKVSFWATSGASTSYPNGGWNAIHSAYFALSESVSFYGMHFTNTDFNGANSVALHLHTPSASFGWASCNPMTITYYVDEFNTLSSGNPMGTFSWIALDGGFST